MPPHKHAGCHQRCRGAVDNSRTVPACLHSSKRRTDFCQHLNWRRPNVAIFTDTLHLPRQTNAARIVSGAFKHLVHHGHNFTAEKTAFLRCHSPRETIGSETVDLFSRDLVSFRQGFCSSAHGDIAGRIEQSLPEKVFELQLPHTKSAAMSVGGDGIAAHGFRAHAKCQICPTQLDQVGGLQNYFHARAAYPLHQMRRHLNRHTGIEANMTRQQVGVEASLGHVACYYGLYIRWRDSAAPENFAGHFDSEVNWRDQPQNSVVVRKWSAHSIEQPDVVIL